MVNINCHKQSLALPLKFHFIVDVVCACCAKVFEGLVFHSKTAEEVGEIMNQMLSNWTNGSEDNSSLIATYNSDFIFLSFMIYCVLFLSGAVLNIIVVFVMARRSGKIRQNISSFLIFHLSVTHLCNFSVTLFYLGGVYGLNAMNSSSCKATVFIDLACTATIFSSLVAIAWDRHRNVLRPFKSLAPRHLKTYLMLVAAIWTYAFITSVPFIYSVRTFSAVICPEDNNGTEPCKEYSWCDLPSDWITQLSKTIYFMLAFVIPLIYMFFTYTKIAVSLWKRSKNGTIHGAVAKCKVRSTRLMVAAVLGFALCWGPTFWIDLLSAYGAFESTFILRIWCWIATTLSSCVNPVIYAFLSPEFRKHFLKFCCCCCTCRVCCSHRRQCDRNQVQPVM